MRSVRIGADQPSILFKPEAAPMAQFTVNPQRSDPYKNFKFRVKWDGRYVAGISRVSALKRTTEVIEHREGGDPSASRKSPGIDRKSTRLNSSHLGISYAVF